MKRKIKKIKRRFRKHIYNFLLSLNEFDFSRLWPVFAGIGFVALFVTACMMPTTSREDSASAKAAFGASIAGDIRATAAEYSTLKSTGDVVAVFLPLGFERLTENELLSYMEGRSLYSFYLTGTELSYLTETVVSVKNETQILYLDGLDFTYHENRLPFDRITELALSDGTAIVYDKSTLYHIIATEEIFSLFHYGAYRSLGMMEINPKNLYGMQLSDYQESVVSRDNTPLTVASAIAYAAMHPEITAYEASASTVTTLGGFNLIALWSSPNKITILMCVLFFSAVVLIWFALPRLHRVILWLKIYAIRSKKRGRHVLYSRKHLSASGSYRRAG